MTGLRWWLRNARFRLRQHTARHPWMFFMLYQLSPTNRSLMVTRRTKITIEGYPRSANTYAVYAFMHVNRLGWEEIAHHLHVQAQVYRSISYGIPVILLIRHPRDAVRSMLVRHGFIPLRDALRDYRRFYEDLYSQREHFIVAPFDKVTRDFGAIIDSVNRRFSTQFNRFPDDDENARKEVFNAIDRRNRSQDEGLLTHLYRPHENKDRLKEAVVIDDDDPDYRQALEIYRKYIELS
jgi:hypothetical protein